MVCRDAFPFRLIGGDAEPLGFESGASDSLIGHGLDRGEPRFLTLFVINAISGHRRPWERGTLPNVLHRVIPQMCFEKSLAVIGSVAPKCSHE